MASPQHHSFQMEHGPRGASGSFSMGLVGKGGGFALEKDLVPNLGVYIGVHRGGVIQCLPYCQAGKTPDSGMADFVPLRRPDQPFLKEVRTRYWQEQEITRTLGYATDTWQVPGLSFSIATPVSGIPDPATAPMDELKDAVCPAILARLTIDNRGHDLPAQGFFAVEGSGYVRVLDDETGGQLAGVAFHDGCGLAAMAAQGVDSFVDFNHEYAFMRDPRPIKMRCVNVGGVVVDVAPGQVRTIELALGFFLGGTVTDGKKCSYLYTRYFSSLPDVLGHALGHADAWWQEARRHDDFLAASKLNKDQQWLLAKCVRSYWPSSQLFQEGNRPRWVVNEGSCNFINTLDLAVDMAFFELRRHPWALRNVLDSFAEEYFYYDRLHAPGQPNEHEGGVSFTHDQGRRNVFTPNGWSAYEVTDYDACWSYMTHEELLNWTLCSAMYVHHTHDLTWLHARAGLLADCLKSMQNRDHPDPSQRDGVMDFDSSRCGRSSEITTYDSLDPSLGQARRNVYLAVKSWAGYLALAKVLEIEDRQLWGKAIDSARRSARLCADTLTAAFDEKLGYIPAILDGKDASAIIPVVEGLVYVDQMGLSEELSFDGEYGKFLAALKRHFINVLVPGRCLFDDDGWKLSANNNNSWMSKIFICQYVARKILGIDFGQAGAKHDRAHADWWRINLAAHSVVDQVFHGVFPGEGSSYPRCVTSILWLEE